KRHTLFCQKNGNYLLNIKPFIRGQITLDNSTLDIGDLLKHDILPQKGDTRLIMLNRHKQGFVTVGDTRIEFSFQYLDPKPQVRVNTSAYSWTRATFKSLTSDLMFKFTFLLLFSLNVFLMYSLKDYEVNIEKKLDITKMPERLARFIPKPPEELLDSGSSALSASASTAETAEKSKEESSEKPSNDRTRRQGQPGTRRGNPAASAGLLGLIGGSGATSKSSSIVDALVDKGLVADLENILGGGTNLKVSKNGNKNDVDPLDQLIGSGGTGGIDDWFADVGEEVPVVQLQKKAKVDFVKPSTVSGSREALGYRTEQSITSVVLSRQGRITYLYEKHLKRNPNLHGKISVEFTIAANGFVTEVRVIESTINQPQLESELVALVKRLKFDPIPSGSVTWVFPFIFSKAN
ncbi:MAG: AgmX/PglI C-terminal domain-containing protein, partial [bacterium]|nr:AgmX/PglI C-terminal domain-containing protein [bacterium]